MTGSLNNNIDIKDEYKFKMPLSDIKNFQKYINENEEQIKKEMNLQYEAVPFPKEIQKDILNDKKFNKFCVNKKFNTILARIEDIKNVQEYIENMINKRKISPHTCYKNCSYQELSEYPFTILYENQAVDAMYVCKPCMCERLQVANQSFYTNGQINLNELKNIDSKPLSILYTECKENIFGNEKYPQIPLGQIISVLFNCKDKDLSSLTSAYLNSINEFAIRYRMRKSFSFCLEHRHDILKIDNNKDDIKCNVEGCKAVYCKRCMFIHDENYICEVDENTKLCPKCYFAIQKIAGCTSMKCKCGTSFCFICGKIFLSELEESNHLIDAHKNIYNVDMKDANNNSNDNINSIDNNNSNDIYNSIDNNSTDIYNSNNNNNNYTSSIEYFIDSKESDDFY